MSRRAKFNYPMAYGAFLCVETKTIPSALRIVDGKWGGVGGKKNEIEIDKQLSIRRVLRFTNVEVHLLALAVLAHLYTIQSQLAANFLLEITPAEDVLEVAFAAKPVESFVAIYRLCEIFFTHDDRQMVEEMKEKKWKE